MVERRDPSVRALEQSLRTQGRAPGVVGFTGAPGTGKSTLVDAVVALLRKKGSSVAVLATDPNSPFTGGAILGDRIRMQRHALDPKVFIRSEVILETVGVGQSELEVAAVADTTVVVLTPNLGDGVQMIKAGILEIADVFVVNKADLEGHVRVVAELRSMLSLAPKGPPGARRAPDLWKPPILATIAARQDGIEELWAAVLDHRRHLESSGRARALAEQRLKDETAEVAAEIARNRVRSALNDDPALAGRLINEGTPYATAEEILDRGR